jgi:GT2 family glycosyltransferase
LSDIAVIIPTFRRPRELTAALHSVLTQDVSVEVVVVDDSPEQSGRPTVERVGSGAVRYLVNPLPTGGRPAAVRNLGWPCTGAPVLHFLDDDDVVPQGYYTRALAELARRTDVGALFGRVVPFGDEGALDHENGFFTSAARRARRASRYGPKWAFVAEHLFCMPQLVCSATLVRRAVVEAIGGFDAAPHLKLAEDIELCVRAFRHAGAAFFDEVALHYRISTGSLIHGRGSCQALRGSYQHMFKRYVRERGRAEFLALKLFARTLLRPNG